MVARSGPLLFTNDGKAHFTYEPKAFQLAQPLRGTLTSAAAADYDRDGFLDLYLCAYSFLIGASEDKAGPPAPYHDAQNGPPNVLLRNDGHGRFVEVTEAVGLREHNDRFSFAASLGGLRRGRLARPAGRERFRPQEPLSQPGTRRRTGALLGRHRLRGRCRLRRRHERGVRRLRQRQPSRHLHRQHVDGGRPARDRAARIHAAGAARHPRALSTACPRQLAVPQPRQWHVRGRHVEGGRRVRPMGVVLGCARFRQRRLRRPVRRQRHVHAGCR